MASGELWPVCSTSCGSMLVDGTTSPSGEGMDSQLGGSFSSLDNPEQFESQKQQKETMEHGIHL